ncbi:MAG: hypothetical protein IKE60_26270 [Reyranella sp.]|uniref:hypothetical protein n=1 Tax=Reyranella sp. TaxID=1929291 RepID=UPI0025D578C9|nr:hypothetical protein [Reyranella sp.]MBR2818195.1 hypothetical protein [Reyranella sp.]
MFEKLKGLLEEAKNLNLTRFVLMTACGFVIWLMLIFTAEFTGVINIDATCGDRCFDLIKEITSPLKPAKAAGFDLHAPSAPIKITVTFLP